LIIFRVVVLPEPEAPTRARKPPDSMESVTPSTAKLLPPSKDLPTS
jgi:hypothetical protein